MQLTEFAYLEGLAATKRLSTYEQKLLGQFMTPPDVAKFMAQRCLPDEFLRDIRIMDPAAGSGVLAAAVVEEMLERENPPDRIKVILYELDGRLIPSLRELTARMRAEAKKKNVTLAVSLRQWDFLLSAPAASQKPIADVIIANPPYFKLSASDARAEAHRYAVYGQPNIYGLFMASAAELLSENGRWCFITPRSWTNGVYFSAVRRHLFRFLRIDAMHIFESRRDHFADDEILQEAMITWATARNPGETDVIVSSSAGSRDLAKATLSRMPISQIISDDDALMVSVPTVAPIVALGNWGTTLQSYGFRVSTGPVVAFRAIEHIRETPRGRCVPLLWMQHIEPMAVRWPMAKKREYIAANCETSWMLVPNANMVIMRRFSPKEDDRRIIAAPYFANSLPGAMLGLENHTNYVCRPGDELSTAETRGLAAYLNSRIVDKYFRSAAGNTQVNAADLRKLPVPPLDKLSEIGNAVTSDISLDDLDVTVERILEIPSADVAA